MPRNRIDFAFFVSLLAVALLLGYAKAEGAPAVGSVLLSQPLPFSILPWIPVATVAVLVVITIAAIVYALSGTIASTSARNWSRAQIYEALLSLVLIAVFGSFSYLFFINPQSSFGALGLVPPRTAEIDCTSATNIFMLATCDLSMFNIATFKLANVFYGMAFMISLIPSIGLQLSPIPGVAGISASLTISGLIPLVDANLMIFAFAGMLTMMLLQQVQLILISASMLFLSLFLTLGLIARTFGFARSFGGAMIAFGLGLGLIYPLLVSITYGYIDVQSHAECLVSSLSLSSCNAPTFSIGAIMQAMLSMFTQTGSTRYAGFYTQVGYIAAGLTFIPFLNFIILDAFIIDFSQAIGERMDFMALLAGII